MPNSIYEFVKEARESYRSQTIQVTEGYDFSQYETLRTIELYHSSKFTSGPKDSLGREKPFYNICKFRVNVATRATDLDTKDVQIQADGGDYAQSFLLTLKNRNWMKTSGFPKLLNKMGHTRCKYGGVLVKKTEYGDTLELHVMPWRDMVTDQVDIAGGVKIERHFYTPADLKAMDGKWSNIDDAIDTAKKQQDAQAAQDGGKNNRTLGANIEVWEVHGVLPMTFLDPEADPNTYARQMHAVVLDESDKASKEAKGVSLYEGREKADPYKYLPWEEIDGRGLGCGVIEDLFEAQVWTNYNEKQKKDMLDLAGKMIFQTTDQNVAAKNVLTDLENGAIVTTAINTAITQVNNVPGSFGAFEKLVADWDAQAERVTSTYASKTGETLPANTPWHLGGLMNQEAGSLFVYRLQEAGIFVQEIYQDWILPFLVKQVMNEKELVADLSDDELESIAVAIANHEACQMVKEKILSGELVRSEDINAFKEAVKQGHMQGSKRRAFKLDKSFFNDTYNVDVITTGEQKNKAVMLETLFNIFQVVAKTPQLLQDPTLAKLFNEIVELAGVSPLLIQPGAATGYAATPQPGAAPANPSPMPSEITPTATPTV